MGMVAERWEVSSRAVRSRSENTLSIVGRRLAEAGLTSGIASAAEIFWTTAWRPAAGVYNLWVTAD